MTPSFLISVRHFGGGRCALQVFFPGETQRREALFGRTYGILLHPTSLPGSWGIGTLGSEAHEFARWMADSGAKVWQVLPLNPPVYNHSPYQVLSSFAGNPLLVSPEELFNQGFLSAAELDSARSQCSATVNWHSLEGRKALLTTAANRALNAGVTGFDSFYKQQHVREWSWFAATKELNGGRPWPQWSAAKPDLEEQLVHGMIQYFFHTQWISLKKYCSSLGIRILGDIPIYAALDSTDVYFNRELFKLNAQGDPTVVAGVPPDYFSTTGQLWGNPVYDWDRCAASGYRWWTHRMAGALELFDAVRIDHFRGFDQYWEVPAGETTAVNGTWNSGPGIDLFRQMEKLLGKLPVVAEDLGIITPSVRALRKQCGFPGMVVLQFALQNSSFSVENMDPNSVIYTGTHDNDTTAGWISSTETGFKSVRSVVDIALSSPADLAMLPMQDVLELDSSARMNTPGASSGNWGWRMLEIPQVTQSFARG
ncbi:MAG: 4-alpha-glucanotransferase [Candidatus Fermentibacteraceae bacterium]|nr:4-alpha-glucanotransferase [Candidatus Fermentibacteraceae bacterium]